MGVKYFEGQFSDGKETVCVVSFESILRANVDKARESREGMALNRQLCRTIKQEARLQWPIQISCGGFSYSVLDSLKKFRIDDETVKLSASTGIVESKALEEFEEPLVLVIGKVASIQPLADCTGVLRGRAWEKDVGVLKVDCT